MVDAIDDMRDGSRGFSPIQTVRSNELELLLGPAPTGPSREYVAAFDAMTDELAGSYVLREKREGVWVVVGTSVTAKEARAWSTERR